MLHVRGVPPAIYTALASAEKRERGRTQWDLVEVESVLRSKGERRRTRDDLGCYWSMLKTTVMGSASLYHRGFL